MIVIFSRPCFHLNFSVSDHLLSAFGQYWPIYTHIHAYNNLEETILLSKDTKLNIFLI